MQTKTHTKKAVKNSPFDAIKKIYGLSTPEQVKLRIIWQHLQALTLKLHGSTPENLSKLKHYDNQFRVAEQDENEQ